MDGRDRVKRSEPLTGYIHAAYARALSDLGRPRRLPRSGGWILERAIQGSPYRDGMGCYPLFVCRDWSALGTDLDDLGDDLVSLVVVTDPFGEFDLVELGSSFHDIVLRYKEHYVVDLSRPLGETVSRHHRYYARKALRDLTVELCRYPPDHIGDWVSLYGNLVRRHRIEGPADFSADSLAQQLSVPGLVMFRVVWRDATVGAQLWYVDGNVAYSHLTALSDIGYSTRASYALCWFALEYFSASLRWLDLGGGAGVADGGPDGLSAFKRGWANGTRPTYLCGRIFDHRRYNEIVELKNRHSGRYFPAYRARE